MTSTTLKRRLIAIALIALPVGGYAYYSDSTKRHDALMREIYTAYDACKSLQVEEVNTILDVELGPDDLIWNSKKEDFKTWQRRTEDASVARKRAEEDAIEREFTVNKAAWECRDGVSKKYGKKVVTQSMAWKSHQDYEAKKAQR